MRLLVAALLVLILFGLHHKKPEHAPGIVVIANTDEALISEEMVELQDASKDYPWLMHWIKPAYSLGTKLLTESGSESNYDDDLEQLVSDMSLIRKMEENDTI